MVGQLTLPKYNKNNLQTKDYINCNHVTVDYWQYRTYLHQKCEGYYNN